MKFPSTVPESAASTQHFPEGLAMLRLNGRRPGDYGYFCGQLELLFMNPVVMALEEYGVPPEFLNFCLDLAAKQLDGKEAPDEGAKTALALARRTVQALETLAKEPRRTADAQSADIGAQAAHRVSPQGGSMNRIERPS